MEGRARADCGSNLMERSYSRERSKFVRGFKRNHFLLSTASKGSCCDNYDGRAAGDAGGAVLRLRPRAACPRQPHASQDRPFRRPVGSEGASGALLQRCGTAVDRSRADDAYADRGLLLRHSFGASAVAGSVDWAGRRRPRSFDVFQEPPRPFPRERSFAQAV
jgi:hypothetical protein